MLQLMAIFIALLLLHSGANIEYRDHWHVRPLHASTHAGTCFGSDRQSKSSKKERCSFCRFSYKSCSELCKNSVTLTLHDNI